MGRWGWKVSFVMDDDDDMIHDCIIPNLDTAINMDRVGTVRMDTMESGSSIG